MKIKRLNGILTLLLLIQFVIVSTSSSGTFEAVSNEGCLDIDGSYLIGNSNSGDLVQLIWTGPDGNINQADEMGNATGDDVIIDSTYIGYGTLTGLAAAGRFSKTFSNEIFVTGLKIYVRVWNSPVVNGMQDAFGNSQIYVLSGEIEFHNFGQVQTVERQSTPVELSFFNTITEPGKVVLKWITQSETENLGFHIYRCESIDGEKQRLTDEMIDGAINSQSRNEYKWIDTQVEDNKVYYYWLADVSTAGDVQFSTARKAIGLAKPTEYFISQNYPNPFNPTTSIKYALKDAGKVKLAIFNIRGQLVRNLVDSQQTAGVYNFQWDGKDENGTVVPSGVYLYTIQVNEFKMTKKMSLTK
ncbi:T9SS type A sorting domain-containing protein [candidate division KSB1 bacterium]|nr:T9SS type A sorting domain-containing protein [candidate division KSB1 bacterium]